MPGQVKSCKSIFTWCHCPPHKNIQLQQIFQPEGWYGALGEKRR